jgi:hypothetical protein
MGGVTLRASIQNRLIEPSNMQTILELFCSAAAGFDHSFQLLSLNQNEWSGSSGRLADDLQTNCGCSGVQKGDFRECGRMIP